MRNAPRHELDALYARAKVKIYEKLEELGRHPEIMFSDFGQRRRLSFLWQDWSVAVCKEMLGKQIVGTSNTLLASRYNLTPIGTNAHELPMVLVALAQNDVAKRAAQYEVLSHWQGLYGIGLRVFLPDTYTTAQFLEHAPEWLARDWRGMRQDS